MHAAYVINIITCVGICLCETSTEEPVQCAAAAEPPARCLLRGGECVCESRYKDQKGIIEFNINAVDRYVRVICDVGTGLEARSIPRLRGVLRPASVTLRACVPPARGSLARALREINLEAEETTSLALEALPAVPTLGAVHVAGLARLARLRLTSAARASAARDLLAAVPRLRTLRAEGVRVPAAALVLAPAALAQLSLDNASLEILPAEVLALPALRELTLSDARAALAVSDGGAGRGAVALRAVMLDAPSVSVRMERLVSAALESLELRRWSEEHPGALARCEALRSLRLKAPAARSLPPRWVAACPALLKIAVSYAIEIKTLPSSLLENATALVEFSFLRGQLQTLPDGLFNDTHNLKELDLATNHITKLPSTLFWRSGAETLRTLDLRWNRLAADSLPALAGLRRLTDLRLAQNPDLAAFCDRSEGTSILSSLTRLERLDLSGTAVASICRDWRELMPALVWLDLDRTNITLLRYNDLNFVRSRPSTVELPSQISKVIIEQEEYFENRLRSQQNVTLVIQSRLHCDCSMYWTWRAYKRRDTTLPNIETMTCYFYDKTTFKSTTNKLVDLSEEELVCPVSESSGRCPERCSCVERPAVEGARVRRLVRVQCERGGWTRVPPLPRTDATLDLLLAHNRIRRLPAHHLPQHFRILDLRNNSIEGVDTETSEALVLEPRRLYISGNPLTCNCSAAPMLRVLRDRSAAVLDYINATCAGGGRLMAASTEPCRPLVGTSLAIALVSVFAAVLTTFLAIAACRKRREWRLVVRSYLDRSGVRPRTRPDREDEIRYDAFVSFSHQDEHFVIELVKRLESASPPYRLCLHYRDWVPGRWIPEQIAESVRRSRRTVAVVSRDFLQSTWARAEFREAYAHALRDATPRLVVVLLEEPERLPLDAELRRYLALNTYVRRGDPWFWRKLQMALPPPGAHSLLPSIANPAPAIAWHAATNAIRDAENRPLAIDTAVTETASDGEAPPRCLADLQ